MGNTNQTIRHFPITGMHDVLSPQGGAQGDGANDDASAIQASVNTLTRMTYLRPVTNSYKIGSGNVVVPSGGSLFILPGAAFTGAGSVSAASGGLIVDFRPATFGFYGVTPVFAGGINVTGGDVNLLATSTTASNFNTHINDGTSTGTVNIGNALSGLITIANKTNTAATFKITNGTSSYYAIDTRTTTSSVIANIFGVSAPTIVSAAGTAFSNVGIAAYTNTLTGGVTVTAINGAQFIVASPTITSATPTTVTTVSSVIINGPLSTGSVTSTNAYALDVPTYVSNGTVAAAARFAAPTGATTNICVLIASSNSGIGVPAGQNLTFLDTLNNAFYTMDTRLTTLNGTTAHQFKVPPIVGVSAGASVWHEGSFGPGTITLTGGVTVTSFNAANVVFSPITVTSSSGTTLTFASAVEINGLVVGGSVVYTTSTALDFPTFASAGGTTASTIRIAMPTAATNLVGVQITGTGMGMFLASSSLQIGGTISTTANQIFTSSQGGATAALFIGNAQITAVSDSRVKKDITPTVQDALATLKRLNVVDFAWDNPADPDRPGSMNSRGRFTGMLGQEMIDVVPWIINAEDPKCPTCRAGKKCPDHIYPWGVEYSHLVPLLVKGIQELSSRLEKARI